MPTFTRASSGLVAPGRHPTSRRFRSQLGTRVYTISGVTKDSTGAVLPSCTVVLFRTSDNTWAAQTTSDSVTGAYTFLVGDPAPNYFAVAYKAGAPAVVGSTVNTLVAT